MGSCPKFTERLTSENRFSRKNYPPLFAVIDEPAFDNSMIHPRGYAPKGSRPLSSIGKESWTWT
jgi:hypothetical protein